MSTIRNSSRWILLAIPAAVLIWFVSLRQGSSDGIGYRVFRTESGWGYDVTVMGKTMIRQPCIPAKEGDVPFPDSVSALRFAAFVAEKVERRESPAVTPEEATRLMERD